MKQKNSMSSKSRIIPKQQEGAKKDIDHTVIAADESEAQKLFMMARNRLVNVNQWHHYAAPITATFRLTDPNGNEINRAAEKSDYFKIDLPAPGPAEGSGYDW